MVPSYGGWKEGAKGRHKRLRERGNARCREIRGGGRWLKPAPATCRTGFNPPPPPLPGTAPHPARRGAHVGVGVGGQAAHAAVERLQEVHVVGQAEDSLEGGHGGGQVQAHVGHGVERQRQRRLQQVGLRRGPVMGSLEG